MAWVAILSSVGYKAECVVELVWEQEDRQLESQLHAAQLCTIRQDGPWASVSRDWKEDISVVRLELLCAKNKFIAWHKVGILLRVMGSCDFY